MVCVSVQDVVKTYRLGKVSVPALRGISLEVAKGAFVALCGTSGSGKTTLLNIIGCIDRPTSGSVVVVGENVLTFPDRQLAELRNRSIGFIFQTFNLIPVLNVYENVEYPLVLMRLRKRERQRRVHELLEAVGLRQLSTHRPGELSGGQMQRVAIARALVTAPRLVLADEPTANLDSQTGRAILDLMQQMNRQRDTTFIFSTHDHQILSYADQVYEIKDGRLV
jgi:putative ABC transport system ATP-binding protein